MPFVFLTELKSVLDVLSGKLLKCTYTINVILLGQGEVSDTLLDTSLFLGKCLQFFSITLYDHQIMLHTVHPQITAHARNNSKEYTVQILGGERYY